MHHPAVDGIFNGPIRTLPCPFDHTHHQHHYTMKDRRPLLKKLHKKPPEDYRRLSLITILRSTFRKLFGDSDFGLWIEEMTLIHIESKF